MFEVGKNQATMPLSGSNWLIKPDKGLKRKPFHPMEKHLGAFQSVAVLDVHLFFIRLRLCHSLVPYLFIAVFLT
jgi:hypothetical protein